MWNNLSHNLLLSTTDGTQLIDGLGSLFSSQGEKTLWNNAVLWYSFMLRILESPGTASCWENLLSPLPRSERDWKTFPSAVRNSAIVPFWYYLKNKVLKLAGSVFREKRGLLGQRRMPLWLLFVPEFYYSPELNSVFGSRKASRMLSC